MSDLFQQSQYIEENLKDGQKSIDYESTDAIDCLLIIKNSKYITLKSFETSTFRCALQKSGDALLTVYPVEKREETMLTKSMEKLQLKDK